VMTFTSTSCVTSAASSRLRSWERVSETPCSFQTSAEVAANHLGSADHVYWEAPTQSPSSSRYLEVARRMCGMSKSRPRPPL
jgi:hypothetical protein